jgi:hypothetical protein
MDVCCVLSGTGLGDALITRPEESYRLLCVVCDLSLSLFYFFIFYLLALQPIVGLYFAAL